MFQGSAHVPKNRHFELIERAGGSLNATTWFDRTNYFETVPSHEMELALYLESDRMGWMLPALTQETLDNQRDVVKNEKRQRYDNQPYGDWNERLLAMVYPPTHPYHHTVIGSMEDLDAATLEDVVGFFGTYYVPNNAVLSLAGDLAPERALDAVERWFGAIPKGGAIPPLPGNPEVPPRIGETVRDQVRSDVPLPRVIVACRVPAAPEEQEVAMVLKAPRQVTQSGVVGQEMFHLGRDVIEVLDQLAQLAFLERTAGLAHADREQDQRDELAGERLGRRDADLRSGMGVDRSLGLASQHRSLNVTNRQQLRAFRFGLA